MIVTILRIVLSSLLRNALRTSLTILGIAIGIAAVIATASIGASGEPLSTTMALASTGFAL